jgi:nucleoside-diphosphate-sugar epimerase
MKIFLAGASGAIGRRLTPLLRSAGHIIVGTTRSADKACVLHALGAEPVVVDVFDTDELTRVVRAAAPQVMIHQLTDLPFAPGTPQYEEGRSTLLQRARASVPVDAVVALEQATLSRREGIVLRYGFLYGPGTWFENEKRAKPALHVDAAAHAAVLAVSKGTPGIYNIAEDDGAVSNEKAKRELGFNALFRIKP